MIVALKQNTYGSEVLIVDRSKDDLAINDLTFLLCPYSECICHEIIDQTRGSMGITMDCSKSRVTDDISGSSGTV